ncbi:NucA/NucB deoxyribonuclease domain-containing protein [Actinomadura meridiana]|uniref:NucA/NucB deoxyribonuclease domain-containing protein n=1 Tax=Actinomadura meridiana TaxID=559626 RepID=UPI003CD06F0B
MGPLSTVTAGRRARGVAPSCDEWPMASTYQGASRVPATDWHAKTVLAQSNNSQGGITGAFYRANRILDGDSFWVRAILPDGRSSW